MLHHLENLGSKRCSFSWGMTTKLERCDAACQGSQMEGGARLSPWGTTRLPAEFPGTNSRESSCRNADCTPSGEKIISLV